jgi:beta-mannanase
VSDCPPGRAAVPHLLIGAHSPPAPYEGMARFAELEAAIGSRLDITHLFQAWGSPETRAFRPDWIAAAASGGRRVLLSWEPWVPEAGFVQVDYALARIVEGRHDGYIASWASALAATESPVWLRPMHEMNGTWYPWAGGIAGNTPTQYVEAWRHLHAIFERRGATNVRWVWAPNSPDVPDGNRFEAYYPGDACVDVLGLDAYNWGTSLRAYGGWRGVDEVFAADLARLRAVGPQPIWITETASSSDGGDKAEWVRDLMALVTADPRVDAVVWFDVLKERDWTLTELPAAALAFGQAGSSRA